MTQNALPGLPWFALRVRTRAEPTVEHYLRGNGYQTFLPTVWHSRRYFNRIKIVNTAMFPGLLFCRIDVRRRLRVLTTPGVEAIAGCSNIPEPVPDAEIDALMRISGAEVPVRSWPYLQTGDRVKIGFGAFAGTEGILVSENGVDRLVVSIGVLQRSVAFETDKRWVCPASPAGANSLQRCAILQAN
jgi:transcription termination/antitermination protein NusG